MGGNPEGFIYYAEDVFDCKNKSSNWIMLNPSNNWWEPGKKSEPGWINKHTNKNTVIIWNYLANRMKKTWKMIKIWINKDRNLY